MTYPNRRGPEGTADALRASNPALHVDNIPDHPEIHPHDHPDLAGRISALEGLFTPDDDNEADELLGDHPPVPSGGTEHDEGDH